MQYDALFKSIFQSGLNSLIPQLVGSPAVEQLNVEFRSLERRTPDLVARLADGRILHIEIQTSNDADMPLRMLHYRVLLPLRFPKETIHQMVLYAGYPALSMPSGLDVHGLQHHYDLVDLRNLDATLSAGQPAKGGAHVGHSVQHSGCAPDDPGSAGQLAGRIRERAGRSAAGAHDSIGVKKAKRRGQGRGRQYGIRHRRIGA